VGAGRERSEGIQRFADEQSAAGSRSISTEIPRGGGADACGLKGNAGRKRWAERFECERGWQRTAKREWFRNAAPKGMGTEEDFPSEQRGRKFEERHQWCD